MKSVLRLLGICESDNNQERLTQEFVNYFSAASTTWCLNGVFHDVIVDTVKRIGIEIGTIETIQRCLDTTHGEKQQS